MPTREEFPTLAGDYDHNGPVNLSAIVEGIEEILENPFTCLGYLCIALFAHLRTPFG
jgi:hypothetical protein